MSIESVNRACGQSGALSPSAGVLGAWALLRKFLGYKEHLDLPKIDLNAAKITTVQDYSCKKKLMWMEVHINSVKAKSQAGNIWVKDTLTIRKGQSH